MLPDGPRSRRERPARAVGWASAYGCDCVDSPRGGGDGLAVLAHPVVPPLLRLQPCRDLGGRKRDDDGEGEGALVGEGEGEPLRMVARSDLLVGLSPRCLLGVGSGLVPAGRVRVRVRM